MTENNFNWNFVTHEMFPKVPTKARALQLATLCINLGHLVSTKYTWNSTSEALGYWVSQYIQEWVAGWWCNELEEEIGLKFIIN